MLSQTTQKFVTPLLRQFTFPIRSYKVAHHHFHHHHPTTKTHPTSPGTQKTSIEAAHGWQAVKKNHSTIVSSNMASVEAVLAGKYPAKAHAKSVMGYIKKKHPTATGVLYLEGQKTKMIEDNDEAEPFR